MVPRGAICPASQAIESRSPARCWRQSGGEDLPRVSESVALPDRADRYARSGIYVSIQEAFRFRRTLLKHPQVLSAQMVRNTGMGSRYSLEVVTATGDYKIIGTRTEAFRLLKTLETT